MPIPGASFSWVSRITALGTPFLLGALVLCLELYLQLPSILRDQLGVCKSTFQDLAAWTGCGGFPPSFPAMLNSLPTRRGGGVESSASRLPPSEDS